MCIQWISPRSCWEQISGLSACWGAFQHMHFGRALTDDRYQTQAVLPLSNSLVGKHHTWIPSGRSKRRAQECARQAHIRCDVMCSHVSAFQSCPHRSWSSWTTCLYFFSESEQFVPMQSSCSGILTLNCLWSFLAGSNNNLSSQVRSWCKIQQCWRPAVAATEPQFRSKELHLFSLFRSLPLSEILASLSSG